MNSLILTVGNEEYQLKISSRLTMEAEKKLGQSILRATMRLDEIEVFAIILWAAMQQFNHGIKLDDVYDIIDDMARDGCSFTDPSSKAEHKYDQFSLGDREALIMAIMKVSGFFSKAEIDEIDKNEEILKIVKTPRKKKSSTPSQS